MSTESEILAEVEALKSQFEDTRALYREVCALLFFRFGITPTANKLYQYVRKGSMGVPVEELEKFWDDLRHKARVDIQRPDLPDDVKALAAEAIAGLWHQATKAARGELEASRQELQAEVEQARAGRDAAEGAVSGLQASVNELKARLATNDNEATAQREQLEAECRAHAVTQARLEEMQTHLAQARAQHAQLQAGFSAELEKVHQAGRAAEERVAASERRALLDVDKERQARIKAEKAVDVVTSKLEAAEAQWREQLRQHGESMTSVKLELNTARETGQQMAAAKVQLEAELGAVRQQLSESQQSAASSAAEAATLKALVERLTPREGAPAARIPRKKPASS